MDRENTCRRCLHFNGVLAFGPNMGECRRNPPLSLPVPEQNRITGAVGISMKPYFSPVHETQCWCGEFSEKKRVLNG